MLHFFIVLFIWSFSYYLKSPECLLLSDVNFIILILFSLGDATTHAIKAFRTLRAEYHLVTGQPLSDCFLCIWPLIHFAKKIGMWLAMAMLVSVSPMACVHSPITACFILAIVYGIQRSANRLRKWWVRSSYQPVDVDDDGAAAEDFAIDKTMI